jgi:hypothetical protein
MARPAVDRSGDSSIVDTVALRCGDSGVDGRLRWRSDLASKVNSERHSTVHGEAMRARRQAETQASSEARQRNSVARSRF